jgi:hypothetical protein
MHLKFEIYLGRRGFVFASPPFLPEFFGIVGRKISQKFVIKKKIKFTFFFYEILLLFFTAEFT